ncbi:uncharacterized protein LOC129610009 [Condylostylus longicornis]|uniref:uncharacterized protein LOC129610009 n=1 Tax=Condylostylus longicornis TaxID=2530218 RepID=UPI00244DE330|nr:uncharacterized protein LOC129610009 [Condylostylus longicornis]
MNNFNNNEPISPPISPPTLRRSYSVDSESDLSSQYGICGSGVPSKIDINLFQQLLQASPQLQRDLALYYEQQQQCGNGVGGTSPAGIIDPIQLFNSAIGGDSFERELANRLRIRRNLNDSIGSLTDSDYYNSDVDLRQHKLKKSICIQNNNEYADVVGNNVKEDVAISLTRVGRLLDMLSNLRWPRMSTTAMGICFLITTFISPKACVQNILFPAFRLVFGTLYPAYASYKAVRTKNVKEYVKWMMYWIVFAFFTCIETFTDIFLSWLPLYYEVKVIVVLWLLNPATKGSSVLYRKFVHPMLTRREQEIDEYLNQAKERGYTAVIQLGSKGVNYATNVIMQTALKGGGNLVQTIRRSYSLSDLSEPDVHRTQDEVDELTRPQHRGLRPRTQVGRSSSSGARHSTGMYFSEIDVGAKGPVDTLHYNIKSTDDISSGYSSAEPISGGLSRTSSMTSSKGLRFKAKKPEDENFSEYDENEYILRENFVPNFDFIRSQSLIENVPQISNISQQNCTKENSYSLETNLGLSLNKTTLKEPRDQAFLNNENLSSTILKEDKNNIIDNKSSDRQILTISTQMHPEMQSKFEMFCEWLENGQIGDEILKLGTKIEAQQISDDEFKDTISVGSNEDRSLDRFDETAVFDMKTNNSKLLEEKNINTRNLVGENHDENVPHEPKVTDKLTKDTLKTNSEGTLLFQITSNKESSKTNDASEYSKSTLKENISVAVDSVTKLKEHILKLNDERTKEFQETELTPDLSFVSEKTKTDNHNGPEPNTNIEINNFLTLSEDTKLHHSKGKAPDPPSITSISSNISSSNLFQTESSHDIFKPFVLQEPSSPITASVTDKKKISTLSSNFSPSSTLLTSNLSQNSVTPISSRSSSPTISSSSAVFPQIQYCSQTKTTSNSRSPSPKPVNKPRRNIFRSYLPSIFRSESPKPKTDDDFLGKETQI